MCQYLFARGDMIAGGEICSAWIQRLRRGPLCLRPTLYTWAHRRGRGATLFPFEYIYAALHITLLPAAFALLLVSFFLSPHTCCTTTQTTFSRVPFTVQRRPVTAWRYLFAFPVGPLALCARRGRQRRSRGSPGPPLGGGHAGNGRGSIIWYYIVAVLLNCS